MAGVDQAESAVEGLTRGVVAQVAGHQRVGAGGRRGPGEVRAGAGQHRDLVKLARAVPGHAGGGAVQGPCHTLGQHPQRGARPGSADASDQRGVAAPVQHVVGRLLVGVRSDQRRDHLVFARARGDELQAQLRLAVELPLLTRYRGRTACGEEGAHALGAKRAVGVVADPARARAGHGIEHRVGGANRHKGHEPDRIGTPQWREATHLGESERLRQGVRGAAGSDIEARVHDADRDAGASQPQRTAPGIRSRDEPAQGLEEQRVVGYEQFDRVGLEPRHDRLGRLVADRCATDRSRGVAELASDGIPGRGLGIGSPLRERREQGCYGARPGHKRTARVSRARRRPRRVRSRWEAP